MVCAAQLSEEADRTFLLPAAEEHGHARIPLPCSPTSVPRGLGEQHHFGRLVFVLSSLLLFLALTLTTTGTTLTFLLDESPYSYNEFIVSLFALCTLGSVAVTPFVGRMNDRIEPWVGTMIGLLIAFVNICIALGSAKHLGGAIVVTICEFLCQQCRGSSTLAAAWSSQCRFLDMPLTLSLISRRTHPLHNQKSPILHSRRHKFRTKRVSLLSTLQPEAASTLPTLCLLSSAR